jgi:hypothetical protein
MSETTPLNEFPVYYLYFLNDAVVNEKPIDNAEIEAKSKLLFIIKSAIKDAEEKLNELPFK